MRERMEKIVAQMLRCNIFLPFGLDLLNFDIIFSDKLPMDAPACTDYEKIYINHNHEMFKERSTNDEINKLLTVFLLHETFHPKLMHKDRRKERDPELWNIACDFCINLLLHNLEKESKTLTVKPLVSMDIDKIKDILLDQKYTNMLEEEIYNDILKKGDFKKETITMSMKDFLKSADSGDGQSSRDNGEVKITKTEVSIGDKKYSHIDVEFPELSEEELKDYEDRRTLARQQMESSVLKGVQSSDLKKFLGKLFKVKVDWERITKDSLMTEFETGYETTWGKPRSTWLANPDLPYLPNIDEQEKFGVVVFAIDESRSMTDADVIKSVELITQAKDYYKGLLVIKHDSSVKWTKYYDDIDDVNINELLIRRHCGGTSHKEVFEFVNMFINSNPDEMVSCFIGVTDLVSDIPIYQNIITQIPRIWLVSGDYQIEVIGRIIKVE